MTAAARLPAPAAHDERARAEAAIRQAARPLNDGLRFIREDGSRNEPAIEASLGRRVAQFRHLPETDPYFGDAAGWRNYCRSCVEAEADGELQSWNVRAGRCEPVPEHVARELHSDYGRVR